MRYLMRFAPFCFSPFKQKFVMFFNRNFYLPCFVFMVYFTKKEKQVSKLQNISVLGFLKDFHKIPP